MHSPARDDRSDVGDDGEVGNETAVLVVGSDPGERQGLRAMLVPLGLMVVEASSAAGARRRVGGNDFAVVVFDARGSDAMSNEVADYIASQTRTEPLPLIVLATGDRAGTEALAGLDIGGAEVMLSPIVPAAFRTRVSLYVDLFEKTEALEDLHGILRRATADSADSVAFQLEMLDRMEELGRAETDIVAKVSHELRSPLTAVMGYVEILSDGVADQPGEEQARILAIIDRKCQALLALIEDLLTTARVEAGNFALTIGLVDVGHVIDRARETIAPLVDGSKLDLSLDVDAGLVLTGDADQIERALLNLLSNSVKFTSAGGRIALEAHSNGTEIVIAVRDSGRGIPLEDQDQLFKRFFRSTRSREQEVPGTGLGLYIVKQIVELHGGAMRVVSSPKGSEFTMLLPVAGPPVDVLELDRSR